MKKTSIIILTYNNLNYTKDCIESIRKYTEEDTYEIIVIDNNSTDNTKNWLKEQTDLKLILNDINKGFPVACNQGIEISEKDNDILLLNNDTIVTHNWLNNLKKCLYSSDTIGAVGPVSNNNENLQGLNLEYNDFIEMQEKAKNHNISDETKWEEKNFLIGFCLLIKNEVIKKIKKLDENYTPGYIEDNDLSLRIIDEGYKLMLCHDTYIYHYLGTTFRKDLDKFYKILNKNRKYFIDKWKFNTELFDKIKYEENSLIKDPKRILEINSDIGTNILKLKYLFNIEVDGFENDKNKRKISSNFTKIYSELNSIKEKYNYILIGNILEKINKPDKFLKNIKKILTKDGYIIGSIENISSIFHIRELIKDNWYFIHNKNYYTIKDIDILFNNNNFIKEEIKEFKPKLSEEDQLLENKLKEFINKKYDTTYITFKYKNM